MRKKGDSKKKSRPATPEKLAPHEAIRDPNTDPELVEYFTQTHVVPPPHVPPPPQASQIDTRPKRTAVKERANRLNEVIILKRKQYDDQQIVRMLREKYHLSDNCVRKYIHKARNRLAQEIAVDPDKLKGESAAFYRECMQSANRYDKEGNLIEAGAGWGSKLRARSHLDELLGLKAPLKIAQTNAAGEDLSKLVDHLTIEELRVIEGFYSVVEAVRKRMGEAVEEAETPLLAGPNTEVIDVESEGDNDE